VAGAAEAGGGPVLAVSYTLPRNPPGGRGRWRRGLRLTNAGTRSRQVEGSERRVDSEEHASRRGTDLERGKGRNLETIRAALSRSAAIWDYGPVPWSCAPTFGCQLIQYQPLHGNGRAACTDLVSAQHKSYTCRYEPAIRSLRERRRRKGNPPPVFSCPGANRAGRRAGPSDVGDYITEGISRRSTCAAKSSGVGQSHAIASARGTMLGARFRDGCAATADKIES